MSGPNFDPLMNKIQQQAMQDQIMQQNFIQMAAGIYTQLATADFLKQKQKLDEEIELWENQVLDRPDLKKPENIRVNPIPLAHAAFQYAQAFMYALQKQGQ